MQNCKPQATRTYVHYVQGDKSQKNVVKEMKTQKWWSECEEPHRSPKTDQYNTGNEELSECV